jgi:exopolysaccharide biosynthesis polyprenyl glycosylphosphotransferase
MLLCYTNGRFRRADRSSDVLHLRWRLIQLITFAIDVALAAAAFRLAHFIRFALQDPAFPAMGDFSAHVAYLPVLLPVWATVLLCSPSLYRLDPTRKLSDDIRAVVLTTLLAGLIVAALAFALKWKELSRTLISLFALIDCLLMISARLSLSLLFRRLGKRGYSFCSVLIAGPPDRAREFASKVERYKHWGLQIAGIVFIEPGPVGSGYSKWPLLGTVEDIPRVLKSRVIDEIIFLASGSTLKNIPLLLSMCEFEGVRLRIVAEFFPSRRSARLSLALLDSLPLITFSHTPDDAAFLVAKRLIDVVVSAAALLLFSPIMILAAIAIKLTSPGPVLYSQERCGLRGRRFRFLKFRSMVADAEQRLHEVMDRNEMDGPVFKLKDDPRVTRVGRFLRRTSIDELPQLFTVLAGSMSLVGPRPPLPSEVLGYDDWQRRRLSVKPGITCLWQVSGRNNVSFRRWMELDLEYIDNCSLWMDMKILAKTIPAVLSGRGAS